MKTQLRFAGAALAAVLWAAPTASAEPILFLDDLATPGIDVIVADGLGSGVSTGADAPYATTNAVDSSPVAGSVAYFGAVGTDWTIAITAGASKPLLDFPDVIDLGVAQLVNNGELNSPGGTAQIVIGFADVDFDFAMNPQGIISEFAFTGAHKISYKILADGTNNKHFEDSSSPVISSGPVGPGAVAETLSGMFAASGEFSVSALIMITHDEAGQITTGNLKVVATPEPGSLALMGLALVGGLIWRRRRSA